MSCFEQSKFKKSKKSKINYTKGVFKILSKKEEIKQKISLDKDLVKFWKQMSDKYPNLRITQSGSTRFNKFTIGTSMGE